MAIRLSALDGIDMGNKSISNASQIDGSIINEDGTNVLVEGEVYTKAETENLINSGIEGGTTGAYGVKWNQETDVYQLIGATNRTQIQSQMKRCVLNNNGTVNYYLDANDSTKKADGSVADLTGASGNVMVQIPAFYYKHSLDSNDHEWSISPTAQAGYVLHPAFNRGGIAVPYRYYRAYEGYVTGGKLISRSGVTPTRSLTRAQFRTYAVANGTNWSMTDWNLLHAVQVLVLTEYGTFDSQSVLGTGNDSGSDYGITTGQSNVIGNGSSGASNDNMWMSYRGIENFYADIWEFIDGINIQNYVPYVNNSLPNTYADDVFTGSYTSTGVTMITGAENTFVKKVSGEFFPTVAGGNSATFVTDAFWSATGNRVLLFGGHAGSGLSGGAFFLAAADAASTSYVNAGAGVSR